MRVLTIVAVLCVGAPVLAQDRPGGGGQRPNPEQFVERMMERDTNSDGQLSKDEVAGTFLEGSFDSIDAGKDGNLSRDEIRTFAESRPRGPGGPGGGGGGPPASLTSMTFHQAMEAVGRAARGLARQMTTDVKAAQASTENLLIGLMSGLSKAGEVKMSTAAEAKFGDDAETYQRELKRSLIAAARAALDLEEALLDNKPEDIAQHMQKLIELRDAAHNLYQEPEEPREGGGPPPLTQSTGGDRPRLLVFSIDIPLQ